MWRSEAPRTEEEQQEFEQSLLKKLRPQIEDLAEIDPYLKEDFYLLLWLKTRKMKVDTTASAIRTSVKWRQEAGMYELMREELKPCLSHHFHWQVDGQDRTGVPMIWISIGLWDVKRYLEDFGRAAFVRYWCSGFLMAERQFVEHNRHLNSKANAGETIIKGITMVIDGTGASLKQASHLQNILAAMDCAKTFDSYFPHFAETMYFVNVNKWFMGFLKVLRPFLGVKNLYCYDTDQEVWQPILLDAISPDQLPAEMGGTKKYPWSDLQKQRIEEIGT